MRVVLDTNHFKCNFPDMASLDAIHAPGADLARLEAPDAPWKEALPKVKLAADWIHTYAAELKATEPVTHVRLAIYPDGGVSRLRIFGVPL